LTDFKFEAKFKFKFKFKLKIENWNLTAKRFNFEMTSNGNSSASSGRNSTSRYNRKITGLNRFQNFGMIRLGDFPVSLIDDGEMSLNYVKLQEQTAQTKSDMFTG
jgi:hypothetical protein